VADVTDATFETEVIERSTTVPVVVDLWAEWCGPCRTLGPILEKVIGETQGRVELAKVDVDANPEVSAAFRVQSIPAVYALKDRQVVDHFMGALPESQVRAFVERLAPSLTAADQLAAKGDEASLRAAIELDPDHRDAITRLAELLVGKGDESARQEALTLLARIPETGDSKRIAALARLGQPAEAQDEMIAALDELLERVKESDAARREFLDRLELMGADPRALEYRRKLTSRLF
jgi:putative thioredoxin